MSLITDIVLYQFKFAHEISWTFSSVFDHFKSKSVKSNDWFLYEMQHWAKIV